MSHETKQPDELPRVEEIKPCPYVNTPLSENDSVNFILKNYEHYSDFVLFEDGKPARCFRFGTPKRELSEEDKLYAYELLLKGYRYGEPDSSEICKRRMFSAINTLLAHFKITRIEDQSGK